MFFYNEYEVAERGKQSQSISHKKNELLVKYVNFDFRCNQTIDIFVKDDKLINNA